MIMNLSGGKNIVPKIDLTHGLMSCYRTQFYLWDPDSWRVRKTIQGPSVYSDSPMNDGDTNAFYCGWMIYSSDPEVWYPWMSYLTFTTPAAPKVWNNSSKLILKLKVGEDVNPWAKSPGKMRAFLSKDFMENSDPAGLANINIIEQSYIYNSENNIAENRQTEQFSGWGYFVFNGQNIEPGTTYYIYLYPYKSDDDAPENPTFNGGGTAIAFKNYPGLAYCYITT